MITLSVNIDHIATIRNAREGREPDPVIAATMAEMAGASAIVCHLREDRRHINDRDVYRLREFIQSKLNLEMAANDEIIAIALDVVPDLITLVPEKREELTTEGGLDVESNFSRIKEVCDKMHNKGIKVSLFVEPDERQLTAAKNAGADIVELHTGTYANARTAEKFKFELNRIISAAAFAYNADLKVAAGHGLNYQNTHHICFIHEIDELSIGHSIISRASLVGLDRAVREMIDLINNATLHRNIDI